MKALFTILLTVLVLVAGLGQAVPASAATTSFKFLHASPDSAAYDFYLDNAKLITLNFTQFSTDFSTNAGDHQFRIFPAGNTTTPVVAFVVNLQANQKYTAVIAGRQAGLRPVVLAEPPIPAPRYFRFRVVNLDPDNGQPVELINIRNKIIIPSVGFTENKWATLPSGAGVYYLRVRVVGQTNPFVTLPPTVFGSRKRYTAWVFNTNPPSGTAAIQRALPEMNMPNVRDFQPGVFVLTQD